MVAQVAYAIFDQRGQRRSSGSWLTLAHAEAAAAALHGFAEVRPDPVNDQVWDTDLLRASIVTTGATGGSPGEFTPYGAIPPDDRDAANLATGLVKDPTGRWDVGDYVVTADDATCYWNGSTWILGVSVRVAFAGSPGSFFGGVPATFVALQAASIVASPADPWTTGQSVALGSGSAHWDGTAWVAGVAGA